MSIPCKDNGEDNAAAWKRRPLSTAERRDLCLRAIDEALRIMDEDVDDFHGGNEH